jgi:hypothetical protein
MKKIIFAALLFISAQSFATTPIVNEKVLEAFNKTFKDVQEISWSEMGNVYEVKFRQSEIRSSVVYDREGTIVRTIRYYGEKQLPILLLTKIKYRFATQKIFGVTEVSTEEGISYQVILEDDKHWTTINIDSYGSISFGKKLRKA